MVDEFGCNLNSLPPAVFDFLKALFSNAWSRVNARGKTALPKIAKLEAEIEKQQAIMKNKDAEDKDRYEASQAYAAAIKEKHRLERPFASDRKIEQMDQEMKEVKSMLKSIRGVGKGKCHVPCQEREADSAFYSEGKAEGA